MMWLLTRDNIHPISSISAVLSSVCEWLARESKVEALEKDLGYTRNGVAETTTRLKAANEKVLALEAFIAKQKTDVARLRTDLEIENKQNDELDWDLETTWKDLATAQCSAQKASNSV